MTWSGCTTKVQYSVLIGVILCAVSISSITVSPKFEGKRDHVGQIDAPPTLGQKTTPTASKFEPARHVLSKRQILPPLITPEMALLPQSLNLLASPLLKRYGYNRRRRYNNYYDDDDDSYEDSDEDYYYRNQYRNRPYPPPTIPIQYGYGQPW